MANKESLIIELDAKTAKLDAKLKGTESKLDKLDTKTKQTDKSFVDFKKTAIATAAALATVAAVTTIAIRSAGSFARELQVAANRSGETVERMQELAFASGTVGVSLEKLGDISKDTNEKIGEFLVSGGGGFQDFADVLGLTAEEARKAAEEFELLSGPDVLQEMVDRMEAAGVSTGRMSFALEGVASDTTDLIPLLTNSGEKLRGLTSDFNSLGITISAVDIKKIEEVNAALTKASSIFDAESKQLIADYSSELIAVIESSVFLGQKTSDMFSVITTGFGNLIDLSGAALNDFINGTETFDELLAERAEKTKEVLNNLLGEDHYEVGKKKGEDSAQGFSDGVLSITVKGNKKQSAAELKIDKEKLDNQGKYIKSAMILSNAFLEDNKAINAGLIIADTATAIMASLKVNPYDYANVAIIAATGLVQLSNVLSSSKGGGSTSGASSGSSSAPAQESFQPETTSLELSDSTASGSQALNITVPSGDELGIALANWMKQAEIEGRI
jgi:hypothetical protein